MHHHLPVDRAWSLFSSETLPRVDQLHWQQQARTFLSTDAAFVSGAADSGHSTNISLLLDVGPAGRPVAPTRVRVASTPLAEAPEILAVAHAGVRAIGGAGFDVLVARAQRLWQVDAEPVAGSDSRAPLVVTALIALVLLAPIVPPGGGTIFGVRGARIRLEALHW